MVSFKDKVAIVTGTSGIGAATARKLANGGANVVALGIDEAANTSLSHPNISCRLVDVSSNDQVRQVMDEVAKQSGQLDVIVNCAAIHPYGTLIETEAEVFAKCLAVNVGSIHLTAKYGVPIMQKGHGGSIINISSVQGHACQSGVAAYVASKGAIHALTRAMALELASDNIRVNSISPGSIRTPILELAAHTFDGPNADIDAVFERFGKAHPLGRIGEPEEVADLVAFLASDSGKFCTGGDYLIDGGLTAGIGVA